jgi:hypothetical protein
MTIFVSLLVIDTFLNLGLKLAASPLSYAVPHSRTKQDLWSLLSESQI